MTARKKGWQEVFVTICGLPWAAGMGKASPWSTESVGKGGNLLERLPGTCVLRAAPRVLESKRAEGPHAEAAVCRDSADGAAPFERA